MPIKLENTKAKVAPKASAGEKDPFARILEVLNKDISFGSKGIKDKEKETFYSEMAVLLGAGVDIKTALEIAAERHLKAKLYPLFQSLTEKVIHGSSFSDAMKETTLFSPYEYYCVQIGEESASLPEVLRELADFYSKKIKLRRKLTQSMIYPIVVISTAVVAVLFMLNFIVPMFADIFKRFDADLPYLTKVIIHLSDLVGRYKFLFLFFVLSLAAAFYILSRQPSYAKRRDLLLLKIPFIGNWLLKLHLVRFCKAMQLLLSARTPLVTALELTEKLIDFYPIEQSLGAVRLKIIHGSTLSASLAEWPYYDRHILSLIKIAEEVNKLDTMFERLTQQLEEELQAKTEVLTQLIEPVLIIFLGGAVALILVAMYLPLFKLGTSFGL